MRSYQSQCKYFNLKIGTERRAGTCVELELLLDLAGAAIPDDGGLVHGARQQQVALPVPLEGEDGAPVVVQRVLQLPCARTETFHCLAPHQQIRQLRPELLPKMCSSARLRAHGKPWSARYGVTAGVFWACSGFHVAWRRSVQLCAHLSRNIAGKRLEERTATAHEAAWRYQWPQITLAERPRQRLCEETRC